MGLDHRLDKLQHVNNTLSRTRWR